MNTLIEGIINVLNNTDIKLTETQKKIREYLLKNYTEIGYLSLKELGVRAGVSEVSILNFCTKFGYSNYISLREAFRDQMRDTTKNFFLDTMPASFGWEQEEKLGHYCAGVSDNHNKMLQSLDTDRLDRCADAIMNARDVLIFGHDISKIVADYLASRLSFLHIRCRAVKLGDDDTVQTMLSWLKPSDCVIIFSFPPYHMPTKNVATYVQHCGASLITISDSEQAPTMVEGSIHFQCMTKTPYFFNSMSVPIHFSEILTYYIAAAMGKRCDDIIKDFNAVENYFLQNHVKGE